MELTLRTAAPRDRDALITLISEFRDELGTKSPSDSSIGRFLAQHLGSSANVVFILAIVNGKGVGYLHGTLTPSMWTLGQALWINDVFVSERQRRTGIARQLLNRVVSFAESSGVRDVSLATNEANQAAQDLYLSSGFEPATEPRWSRGREILFTRSLPNSIEHAPPQDPAARPSLWIGHAHMTVPDPTAAHDYYVALGARSVMCGTGFSLIELRGGTHIEFGEGTHEPGDAPFDLMVEDLKATRSAWAAAGHNVSEIIAGDPHSVFVLTDLNDFRVIVFDSHVIGVV